MLSYFQTRKAVANGTIKIATNHQHSHSIFVGFFSCIRQGPQAGRKARQCHHQGTLPSGGENLPDHTQPCGTGNPPCHRSCLGQRRPGYFAKIFRLYSQQYQGKTHEFGVHRPYRRQIVPAAQVQRGGEFLTISVILSGAAGEVEESVLSKQNTDPSTPLRICSGSLRMTQSPERWRIPNKQPSNRTCFLRRDFVCYHY